MLCAAACYLIVGLSSNVIVAFAACILIGFFTSMLWPGALILMEERIPHAGVAAFAMMAAGGDLGASVAPQLMGVIVDGVAASRFAIELGVQTGMHPEQIGMRVGMIVIAIFPILGAVALILTVRYFKRFEKKAECSVQDAGCDKV